MAEKTAPKKKESKVGKGVDTASIKIKMEASTPAKILKGLREAFKVSKVREY